MQLPECEHCSPPGVWNCYHLMLLLCSSQVHFTYIYVGICCNDAIVILVYNKSAINDPDFLRLDKYAPRVPSENINGAVNHWNED